MIDLKKNGPLLSQDELDCLSTWRAPYAHMQAEMGFRYRMLFLVAVAIGYAVKLLFFTGASSTGDHLGGRGWLGVLAACAYFFTYVRNWHFEKVAVGFASFALAAFMLDYAHIAQTLSEMSFSSRAITVGLYLTIGYCLGVNAMRADRLAPRQRRLWT